MKKLRTLLKNEKYLMSKNKNNFLFASFYLLFSQIKVFYFYFHKLLSSLTKTKITLVSAET